MQYICFKLHLARRESPHCSWVCLTYSILEVSVTYQFEVLLYSLCSKRVFPKDQVFTVHESIHLTHCHVRQELLRKDYICCSVEHTQRKRIFLCNCSEKETDGTEKWGMWAAIIYDTTTRNQVRPFCLPLSSLCSEGCAQGQTPPPLCFSHSTVAPGLHTVFGSCL